MAASIRQQNRSAILRVPGEEDELVLARFDGSEGVNTLFEFRVEALSEKGDINFDSKIGKNVSVLFKSASDEKRVFDGILTETQWLGARGDFFAYRLVLRPWFWILSQRSDCFIFHEKTVTDIVGEVFHRHSFAVFDDRTIGEYKPIEYCVQYRETDMAFVCRLLEQYGINYFFAHTEGEHKLVLCDDNDHFDAAPGGSRAYVPLAIRNRKDEELLTHWIPERRFTSGRLAYRDYNFKKPTARMDAEATGTASYEHAGQELYNYPGKYEERDDGDNLAKLHLEEEEGQDKRCLGSGNCVSLYPGTLMTLTEHPFDYNKEYVVLAAQHSFTSQQYRSGDGSGGGEGDYDGQFEFGESSIPLRPGFVTRKPLMHGPQTAVVVGQDGEEIDCDKYGRILVRFFWDRKKDQSMRCRISQNWASRQWGGMIIPRIGMEVVVEFLEGDPDRPLVTGCVYNGDNMPPYELPAYKTRSTFKSHSHKSDGYNEIRFEDEKGQEEVWFHAQRYHNGVVGSDETWSVGGNRHKTVGASQSETIGAHKDINVGANHREAIGSNMSLAVGASRFVSIGSSDSETIGQDQAVSIGGSQTVTVGMNHGVTAGKDQFFEAGNTHHIAAGKDVVVEAALSITLIVGGNYIRIDPSGISIEGMPKVSINCSMPVTPAPAKMTMKKAENPAKYEGAHAKRYDRSYKK